MIAAKREQCFVLSEPLKIIAKKELNEDSKQINANIVSFRRWIKAMPHLTVDIGLAPEDFCPNAANFQRSSIYSANEVGDGNLIEHVFNCPKQVSQFTQR
ncbi:unnamed protein product [Protopolystoma xenopodis]|uniref:Uncharacterized protein n=1 Tax=Protopolystoma xenopodis TaxID=117903 RepID=A0A448WQE2_9PLAT|nr:unnamed protein product [Protopolystoma xenopodis]